MITHFEFLLAFPDNPRGSWHRLQGPGGQLGNGCLAAQPQGQRLARVRRQLLILARAELAREGTVRIWHDDRENPAERIEVARPTRILLCREVHHNPRAAP